MVSVHSFSEVGGHLHNEDAFAVQSHPSNGELIFCCVADGQGGRSGGGRAARLACRIATELVVNLSPARLMDPLTWTDVLRRIDEAVEADDAAGFTTFVGLCWCDNRLVGASSGDSAALLLCEGEAIELTRGQRKNPPVGSGAASAVTFEAVVDRSARVLVLTDGVWKYVGWNRVIETARGERGDALIAALQVPARLPGSGKFQDDFTVILLQPAQIGIVAGSGTEATTYAGRN